MTRIGVADTTFARYDMAASAIDEIQQLTGHVRICRLTVPGIKDLPVAAKRLFLERSCELVIAVGMPGAQPIDKQCAHEASLGIQQVQIERAAHVLEVFVHEDEAEDEATLARLADRRAREHARNAYRLLFHPEELTRRAGTGQREGLPDAGPLRGSPRTARVTDD